MQPYPFLLIFKLINRAFFLSAVTCGLDVEIARAKKPNIIALSALLTTTMVEMKNVINALKEAGLRVTVGVIVGGAPVTQSFDDEIGADGYAYDSPGAAQLCKELI